MCCKLADPAALSAYALTSHAVNMCVQSCNVGFRCLGHDTIMLSVDCRPHWTSLTRSFTGQGCKATYVRVEDSPTVADGSTRMS